MKKTQDISNEIVKSLVEPMLNNLPYFKGISLSSNDVMNEIQKHQDLTPELNNFIDFIKKYVIAIKMAYRLPPDRRPFYELIGMFLKDLERVGDYKDTKYDEMLDKILKYEKENFINKTDSTETKIEKIFELSGNFIDWLEEDYANRKKAIMDKKAQRHKNVDPGSPDILDYE